MNSRNASVEHHLLGCQYFLKGASTSDLSEDTLTAVLIGGELSLCIRHISIYLPIPCILAVCSPVVDKAANILHGITQKQADLVGEIVILKPAAELKKDISQAFTGGIAVFSEKNCLLLLT